MVAIGREPLLVLVFAAVVLIWLLIGGGLDKWFQKRRVRGEEHRRKLHQAKVSGGWLWGAPLAFAGCVFLLALGGAWFAGVVLGFLAYKLIDGMPRRAIAKRSQKFDEQLTEALNGLANSLKAGMSLPQAVEQVARNSPAPMAQEFATVMREYELGKPIEQAFEDLGGRVESRNFALAVAAFRVGKERGGNLSVVFEKIANSIREIYRIEEHVRTVTTQGRSSARFMTAMPAVFLVLLYFMDSEGMTRLFTDSVGVGILTAVFLINVLCHLWIRRILAVDI